MSYAKDPANRFSVILWLFAIATAVLILMLCGCAKTIVATPVHDRVASYDGAYQNSGVLEAVGDGFLVTPKFRDRYNALVLDYGEHYKPAIAFDEGISKRNDNFFIDNEHMVKFLDMNGWKKSGKKPKSVIDKVKDKIGI